MLSRNSFRFLALCAISGAAPGCNSILGIDPFASSAGNIDGGPGDDASGSGCDLEGTCPDAAVTPPTLQFGQGTPYLLGGSCRDLVYGDFNHDNIDDLVALVEGPSNSGFVSMHEGNATNGTFAAPVTLDVEDTPHSIILTRLGGDPLDDLLVVSQTGGTLREGTSAIPTTNFEAASTLWQGWGAKHAVSADIDSDDVDDIVFFATNPLMGTAPVVALKRTPGAQAVYASESILVEMQDAGGGLFGNVAVGDLNGDGRADLVTNTDDMGRIDIALQSAETPGQFGYLKELTSETTNGDKGGPPAIIADVVDEGGPVSPDIVTGGGVSIGNLGAQPQNQFFGIDLSFGLGADQEIGVRITEAKDLVVADMNSDGLLDVVIVGQDMTSEFGVAWIILQRAGGFYPFELGAAVQLSDNPSALVVGNFDNNQELDIAVCSDGGNSMSVYLQTP